MSEMVERVARAIAEARFGIGCPVDDDDSIAARAAIEAMRGEMTDAMYFAACDEMDEWTDPTDGECIKAVFKAAIDAALTETQASSSEIAVQQQPEKQDG